MEELIGILNLIILSITAYIVWRYTKAAQKSNEIQERPILNVYLREDDNGVNKIFKLRLRNVGNGPAYNISFSAVNASGYIYHPYLKEANPILEKDDEKTVDFRIKTPDGGTEFYDPLSFQQFFHRLFPQQSRPEEYEQIKRTAAIFFITYYGINGDKYYSVFRFYSKMWPVLDLFDLVIEFMGNKCRDYSFAKAYESCSAIETIKKLE